MSNLNENENDKLCRTQYTVCNVIANNKNNSRRYLS